MIRRNTAGGREFVRRTPVMRRYCRAANKPSEVQQLEPAQGENPGSFDCKQTPMVLPRKTTAGLATGYENRRDPLKVVEIHPAAFSTPSRSWLVVTGTRQTAELLSVHKNVTPSVVFHSHRDGKGIWATGKSCPWPIHGRHKIPVKTATSSRCFTSPVAPRGAVNHGRGVTTPLHHRKHLPLPPWAEGGCSARDLGTLFFRNPICDTGLRNANFILIYAELVQLPAGLAERPRRGYVRSRGVVGNTTTPRCWLTRYRVGRRREAKPVSIRPPAAWAVVAGSSPVGVARFHGRGGTRDRPLKSQPFPLCWGTNGRLALSHNQRRAGVPAPRLSVALLGEHDESANRNESKRARRCLRQ